MIEYGRTRQPGIAHIRRQHTDRALCGKRMSSLVVSPDPKRDEMCETCCKIEGIPDDW